MLRNSTFDPEEIDREKGVIVEEMNMYFDTPRDFIGGVYESLLYGDQPLGRDIIGTKETVRAATRDTFTSFIDRWYRPERIVVGIGGNIGDGLAERLEELLGSIEARETGLPEPVQIAANGSAVKVHSKQSDQAHIDPRRPQLSDGPPRPVRAPAARHGARRRDVVAALHRGTRAARPRLLRLRHELEPTRTPARSTRRRASTSSASTTP